jgi:tRNA G46 methylase TrmB
MHPCGPLAVRRLFVKPTRSVAAASAAAVAAPPGSRRRRRARQHVNPLARSLQQPTPPPRCWGAVYADPTLPLHVDIGCAFGTFSEALAQQSPDRNVLG